MQKMDESKLFVAHASKWTGRYTINKKKRTQLDGSIVGTTKTYIIHIEEKKTIDESQRLESNDVPVTIISPSQAVFEQAETKIERYI